MGLMLTAQDVAALEERTEGWIAALQLAALSMQGRDDTAGFIAGFAGDDRYIVDYLVEEVLQRQPEDVRMFLLRTSILTRLNGSLCDAVTGAGPVARPCWRPSTGRTCSWSRSTTAPWYRYHHLFATCCGAPAGRATRRVRELHRGRATGTTARRPVRGDPHALAGEDFERAATWSSWRSRTAAESAGGHRCGAGSRRCPTR
jgi:LuxR family maltose regulon positive regulatory protein